MSPGAVWVGVTLPTAMLVRRLWSALGSHESAGRTPSRMNTAYDAVVELWGATCRIAVGTRAPVQWYAHTEQQSLPADPGRVLFASDPLSDAHASVLTDVEAQLSATLRTADVDVHTLWVLVYPPAALTVQAPLRAEASDADHRRALVQQAALLTGPRHAQSIRLACTRIQAPLPAPEPLRWYRGLVVPYTTRTRVEDWSEAVSASEVVVTHGAICARDAATLNRTAWHLGLGCHPEHTIYALWHGAQCAYVYYTPLATTPEDRAYFAALLLNRLRLSDAGLEAVWTYGTVAEHASRMPPIAGIQPRLAQPPQAQAMRSLGSNRASEEVSEMHPLRWMALHSTLHQAGL